MDWDTKGQPLINTLRAIIRLSHGARRRVGSRVAAAQGTTERARAVVAAGLEALNTYLTGRPAIHGDYGNWAGIATVPVAVRATDDVIYVRRLGRHTD